MSPELLSWPAQRAPRHLVGGPARHLVTVLISPAVWPRGLQSRFDAVEEHMSIDREALARSLRDLAATTSQPDGLLPVLQRLTDAAKDILRADGAALTLEREVGSIGWVTVTDPVMQLLEEVQQEGGTGPSVSAYTDDQVVLADDLGTEVRWSHLAVLVRQVSVRSVLSTPIRLNGRPVGTLDVYATRPGNWSAEVVAAAEAFARVAADLLQASVERSELRREVAQLQHALTARIWIEQAKGVLVAAQGLTPEAAFERLRAEGRSSRRKVAEVAREVVQAAQRERLAALAASNALVRAGEAQARYAELAMAELEARQARAAAAWDGRATRADARGRAADARDQAANARGRAADQRDQVADERDRAADAQDVRADHPDERHSEPGPP